MPFTQNFSVFSARWVSFKKIFSVFGFKEDRFPVSHIFISPLSVNTSLIVGNHLWTVFNHYHLSSALALFANWLIKALASLFSWWIFDPRMYIPYMKLCWKVFILRVKFVLFAHWSLCNLFVWWSHDHFIRQWMKHNFTHFSLSHAERKKCGGDFFSENTIPYQNEFLRMDRTSITWMAEDQQLFGVQSKH